MPSENVYYDNQLPLIQKTTAATPLREIIDEQGNLNDMNLTNVNGGFF